MNVFAQDIEVGPVRVDTGTPELDFIFVIVLLVVVIIMWKWFKS